MKRLSLLLLIACRAANPQNTAIYPAAVVSNQQLFVAANRAQTTLTVSASDAATTITVASTALFDDTGLVTIDDEVIATCAKTATTFTVGWSACPSADGRAFDGTTAAAHASGAAAQARITAWHHNQLAAEVRAIELALGANLGNVMAADPEITAIAGLTSAADRVPYYTGSGTAALATFTSYGRTLAGLADAAAGRTALALVIGTDVQAQDAELAAIAGLTSAADRLAYFTGSGTASLATFTSFGRTLAALADASAGRTALGLVIGTDVQAQDAELAAVAGLTSAANALPYFTGSGTAAVTTLSAYVRTVLDDADAATARATLGAGTASGPGSAVDTGCTTYNGTGGQTLSSPTGCTIDADGDATFKSVTIGDGTVAGEVQLPETTANGVNYISWLVPDAITTNLRLRFPNASPSGGQSLVCGTPSSTISDCTWETPGSGSGTGLLTATGTLDFGSLMDGVCADLTFAATGFTTGMATELGAPSGLAAGLTPTGWVSAADTASVRLCNLSGATVDPASASYRITQSGHYISATGTINFPALVDGECSNQTLTVTGLATGYSIAIGRPAAIEAGLVTTGFVSAADTVTVRGCNLSGATLDPASATYRATLN